MCLNISRVNRTFAYNWAGDQIVSPLVSAARRVPGSRSKMLDIDVREFLAIDHSAEVRNFFLREILDGQPVAERERFFVGRKGNFDFRMRCAVEAFGKFRYRASRSRGREEWLLPAETLANSGGDCEDLAFLLMALLEECGISRACLRLALGRLAEIRPNGTEKVRDHAWVMYQLEGGSWMVLDPVERVDQTLLDHRNLRVRTRPAAEQSAFEYRPLFVFNRDHLWRVHGPARTMEVEDVDTYVGRRKLWENYDPAFALGVHNGLFDSQMKELSWMDRFAVKSASLGLDANVLSYDPRDHCDFAYVDESWERIRLRLASGSVGDLGRACHAIADFYAHTMYAHVVAPVDGKLPLYEASQPINPGSKQDVVFDRSKFSINNDKPMLTEAKTRSHWSGKLISGQWWRDYTTYPNDIQNAVELDPRRCLPDHDLLAVDDLVSQGKAGHLYPTKAAYNAQFALRHDAAARHVRAAFLAWRALHH